MLIDRSQPKVWRMPTQPKPSLKAKVIPVFRVHYRELERYIQEVFGFDFDLLMSCGCVAGACPEFQITGALPTDGLRRQADSLRTGQRTKNLQLILNVLVADGYIHAGQYIVDTKPLPDLTEVYRRLVSETNDPDHPHCLEFKRKHAGNLTLMQRVSVLDSAVKEQNSRGKRKSEIA